MKNHFSLLLAIFVTVLLSFTNVYSQLSQKVNPLSVKIGTQTWMAQNLDVVTFRNGDTIQQAKTAMEWQIAGEKQIPTWCYYEFAEESGKTYGKLYNWFAVGDARLLAPAGWHIPVDAEWKTLEKFLQEEPGKKLKNTSGWNSGGNGTNETGFCALPGGTVNESSTFFDMGDYGYWWYNEEEGKNVAWYRRLQAEDTYLSALSTYKAFGCSVRCIQD